ncbi:MAG: hypothetical protein HFJ10_07920 [Lachnospiraceae bacterium]|jgi:predicted Holliday junction resolvase-like endonuclease|nr:hypothetical protein [Lachnospiraceae bacterium]
MFEIFMAIGWAVLLMLLLLIWADIRNIASAVKENKRELLRSTFGGRNARNFKSFQEENDWKTDEQEENETLQPEQKQKARISSLNESEEQVLREVLTEFLG